MGGDAATMSRIQETPYFQSHNVSSTYQGYPIGENSETSSSQQMGGRTVTLPRDDRYINEGFSKLKECTRKVYDHYAPTYSSSNHNCCRSRWSRTNFFFFSFGDRYSHGGRQQKNDAFLAVILGIGSLIAGFVAGRELGHLQNCDDALSNVKDLSREALNSTESRIVSSARSTLATIKNSSITSLILKVALAAGLLIAAVGAAIPEGVAVFGLGFTAAFVAGMGLAINAGVHAATRFNSSQANRLDHIIQDINELPGQRA